MFQRLGPLGDPMTDIQTGVPQPTPDLIVAFDYGQFKRLRLDAILKDVLCIGFDHHPPGKNESDFPKSGIEICDPTAPSTTALLYRFFQWFISPFQIQTEIWLTPELAECLLVGLMADTSKLTNKLTSQEALELAATLTRAGADYHGVLESMQMKVSRSAFNAQMKARDRIFIDMNLGLAFIHFSQRDLQDWGGVSAKDILPLHGVMQNIEGVQVAAAYYERPDGTWYCSLRNKSGKGVNVGEIARRLAKPEGGGHDYAAGFTSYEAPNTVFKNISRLLVE